MNARTDAELRVPPHSVPAEQALLGGILLDAEAWDSVSDKIAAADFYRREHRALYTAMEALTASRSPLDAVSLSEHLERAGTLIEAGGLPYVGQLVEGVSSSANVEHYAKLVRDHAICRQLIVIGGEIQRDAYQPNGRDAAALLQDTERRIFEIAEEQSRGCGGSRPIRTVMRGVVNQIDAAFQNGGEIIGLSTGFVGLDSKTSGLQPGDLVVLAGRPSSGKTSLAMNIAENVAIEQGSPVQVFSLEMSADAIALRSLASVGRLDFQRLRSGRLKQDEWSVLPSATSKLSGAPLHIDDTPALSPTELRSRARRAYREHGSLALIVVDYLGLLRVPGIRADNRVAEVAEISRSLKALAKELNVPVLACAQLNRSLESRANKRPIMSDLRDSGSIEQDADLILFVYREEVYDENTPQKGIAEIIIGKQRNGPTGTVYLTAALERMRFESFGGQLPRPKPTGRRRSPSEAGSHEY
ncbi:MAG: replicative DNA helicase [Pseudomonadota bacterium]|nr:replicative DNA helicase [Pseudomonadota bacterium]